MTTSEVLGRLEQLGGTISPVDNDSLRVRAPKPLPRDIIDDLRAHKAAIFELLVGSGGGVPSQKTVSAGVPRVATVPSGYEVPRIVKGTAVCLYSNLVGDELWLAADEEDAEILVSQGERRGRIYTREEVRLVIAIRDLAVVKEIHEFKQEFDTRILPPDG